MSEHQRWTDKHRINHRLKPDRPAHQPHRPWPLVLLVLLLVVWTHPPPTATAQGHTSTRFQHLTVSDGLSNGAVFAMLQDRQGFLWFGTRDGLNRYDGYEFQGYTHDPDDPTTLSNNYINHLYEDREGIIWISTHKGLNRFDPRTETITRYTHDPANPDSLNDNNIRTVYQDSDGVFWVGTNSGLNRFDPATATATRYTHDPDNPYSIGPGWVWSITEDAGGQLWLGLFGGGLCTFDPQQEPFICYTHDPDDPDSLSHDDVTSIHRDSNGALWVATYGGGLNRFNPDTGGFTHYTHNPADPTSMSSNAVMALYEDSAGQVWVGTDSGGLNRFDPQTHEVTRYRHDPADPDSLSNNGVLSILEDRSGILWLGTDGGGVSYYSPLLNQFHHYRSIPTNPHSLSDNLVKAMYQDNEGTIWIGTDNGVLNRFDRDTNTFTHYQHDPADPTSLGLRRSSIRAITEDSAGSLWIGQWAGGGLSRLDRERGTFDHYVHDPANPQSLSSNDILTLHGDESGALWVGTFRTGLNRLDPDTGLAEHYLPVPDSTDPLNQNSINLLYRDSRKRLWVGTWQGLYRFDPATDTLENFLHTPGDLDELAQATITSLCEAPEDTLWVGTTEHGGYRLDIESATITSIHDPLNQFASIGILTLDAQGYLWVLTSKGLARLNPDTGQFYFYDAADGLPNLEFSAITQCKVNPNELLFGTTNGLYAFSPDRIKKSDYQPPVLLTNLRLFNEPVGVGGKSPLQQAIWSTEHLTLSHKQSIISFEFAALDYAMPSHNRYRYKLEGYDEKWNDVDSTRRFATYTNLPAGHYTFRVQGSNKDGLWSEHEVALALTVLPPWWETLWFRGAVVAALVVLVAGAFRWRVQTMTRQQHQLEQEVASRTRELREARDAADMANRAKSAFLANMSHELRTPLNAILGFTQLLQREAHTTPQQTNYLTIIQRSGYHLLTLINDVLDMAKIESGRTSLHEADFDLYGLLDELEDVFQMQAQQKNLRLTVDCSPDVPRYIHTDETRLRQILINLLSNAIKFTHDGSVTLRVRQQDGNAERPPDAEGGNDAPPTVSLRFSFEDTGPGIASKEIAHIFEPFTQARPGTDQGTGLGLSISRAFVQRMGGTITVQSKPGQGSTFTVALTVGRGTAPETTRQPAPRHAVGLLPGRPAYRVLIVDDQWSNRQLLVSILAPLGFTLQEASNGIEAIDVAEAWHPHLVIMDVRMPEMDGCEAANHIKARGHTEEPIIIGMTAAILDEHQHERCMNSYTDMLYKPFETQDVIAAIDKHLNGCFVYEEIAPAQQPPWPTSHTTAPEHAGDMAADVARLPAELLLKLEHATILGDLRHFHQFVLNEIHPLNAAVADALIALANEYAYSQILDLIHQAK